VTLPFLTDVESEITLRLVVALAVGGLIGLERSYHARPAGFRTHALVCLSTSLLMLVTVYERIWFTSISETRTTLDPTRMAQGIMTGIGFLGAGAIMRTDTGIQGLTTAATVWVNAAVGVAAGGGKYHLAFIATGITLAALLVLQPIERTIARRFPPPPQDLIKPD
jgi:putative Mg2+ transporter-C (MgtC) family protein